MEEKIKQLAMQVAALPWFRNSMRSQVWKTTLDRIAKGEPLSAYVLILDQVYTGPALAALSVLDCYLRPTKEHMVHMLRTVPKWSVEGDPAVSWRQGNDQVQQMAIALGL
jgi:hypothetical protein